MSESFPPVLFRREHTRRSGLADPEDDLVKFDDMLQSVSTDYPGLPALLRRREELVKAAYGGVPELDLHLTGDTVHGHATDAAHLARFIGAASQAVKEVTKSVRGLKRLVSALQVMPGPGSVRLTFSPNVIAPPPGAITDQKLTSTETLGLRRLVNLMLVAQTTGDITGAEMLAAVQDLTPAARRSVSAFARAAVDGEYDVEGTWVDPGRGTTRVQLTQRAAQRLTAAATRATQQVTRTTLDGTIDGWEWTSSTVKFRPTGGRRFRAHVPEDLAAQVAQLGAERDHPVRVTLVVVTTFGAGSDKPTGHGYTVDAIESVRPAKLPRM